MEKSKGSFADWMANHKDTKERPPPSLSQSGPAAEPQAREAGPTASTTGVTPNDCPPMPTAASVAAAGLGVRPQAQAAPPPQPRSAGYSVARSAVLARAAKFAEEASKPAAPATQIQPAGPRAPRKMLPLPPMLDDPPPPPPAAADEDEDDKPKLKIIEPFDGSFVAVIAGRVRPATRLRRWLRTYMKNGGSMQDHDGLIEKLIGAARPLAEEVITKADEQVRSVVKSKDKRYSLAESNLLTGDWKDKSPKAFDVEMKRTYKRRCETVVAMICQAALLKSPLPWYEPAVRAGMYEPAKLRHPDAGRFITRSVVDQVKRRGLAVLDNVFDEKTMRRMYADAKAYYDSGKFGTSENVCNIGSHSGHVMGVVGGDGKSLQYPELASATSQNVLRTVSGFAHEFSQNGWDRPLKVPARWMLSCYPGDAKTKYSRHTDAYSFETGNRRELTMMVYLNVGWNAEANGGILRTYLEDEHPGEGTVDVEPIAGRVVIFHSRDVPHEVLPSDVDRFALTLWVEWEGDDEMALEEDELENRGTTDVSGTVG